MQKLSSFFIMVLFIGSSFGQDYSLEYGKITSNEAGMESYPYDKEAPAAVLYDIGKSYFVSNAYAGGYDVVFERKTKIKIFSQAGNEYAEISIPFYHEGDNYEKAEVIEATTYNLENGIIKQTCFNPKNALREKINENWDVLKFAMPAVKEGSVIEYSYKVQSPYKFNLQDWEFQSDIPVRFSKYIAVMIPYYEYVYLLQGAERFDYYNSYETRNTKYSELVHEYLMENVPAFKDEGYITSRQDYIIKLDFQLRGYYNFSGTKFDVITTWPKLCQDLLADADFGKYISTAKNKTKEIVGRIQLESKTKLEAVEKISDYVKTSYSWNGRNGYRTNQSVNEFMKTKRGSIAEINLFFLGMIQNLDIEAYPVILSTRDHGKIKADFPFAHFFNFVTVLVNDGDKQFMADATETLLPFTLLPPKCLNDIGLVVNKKEPSWISLQKDSPSKINHTINLTPKPGIDSVQCNVIKLTTNYDAFNLRMKINDNETSLLNYIESDGYSLIEKPQTRNFHETNKPYVIAYNANIPLEYIGNKIYISPLAYETQTENPFKNTSRTYNLDMVYAKSRSYRSNIEIPEGYSVEFIPQEKNIDNSLFSMSYKAAIDSVSNKITVDAEYFYKKAVYEASEYKTIRYFTIQMIDKLNEKIVFVKEE